MPRLELVTIIRASPETCFDLSRDLDLHARSMLQSGERAIGGKTTGLIGPGEEVLWQARHFAVNHKHRSRITAYERPFHFRDVMVEGRFKRFEHNHYFEPQEGGTRMRDVILFESPLGPVGQLFDWLFLTVAGLGFQRGEKRSVTALGSLEQLAATRNNQAFLS